MKFEIAVCREVKPDLFSWLIMKFTKRPYSHIFVIVDDYLVFHADSKGVVRETIHVIKNGAVIVKKVEVKPRTTPEYAFGWLNGSLGPEYSLRQCLGMICPPLRPLLKNGGRARVCSEYVGAALKDGFGLYHQKLMGCTDFLNQGEMIAIAEEISLEQGLLT